MLAHELGHQYGAEHPYNGTVCNDSRWPLTSVEPGSGSTIMGYAGVCGTDDLQPHSDAYWSHASYREIETFVTTVWDYPDNEVQTVSLRNWTTNGRSFKLRYNGATSAAIVRGANYTAAAIAAAVEALTGEPVLVRGWGAPEDDSLTPPADNGFEVAWHAHANNWWQGVNMQLLEVVEFTGGASGFVGETDQGGPVDNQGHTATVTANRSPVVAAPGSYAIPRRTPFALTASATDADGDPLTYLWEQTDRGGDTGTSLVSNTKTTVRCSESSVSRVHAKILRRTTRRAGTPSARNPPGSSRTWRRSWRTPPTRQPGRVLQHRRPRRSPRRSSTATPSFCPPPTTTGFGGNAGPPRLHFRATVRDGNPGAGGVSSTDTTLVLANAGPFRVTSLGGSGTTLPGGSAQTITWDVARTNTPSLAEAVKISLSSDGGMTYPTVLAGSTSNDGSHTVVLPNPTSPLTESRVKVEAVGNIFFDVNDADFTIDPDLDPPDLVVSAISDPPTSGAQGSTFAVTDRTRNRGEGPAGESRTRYYLSPGTTLASARRLSGARVVPPLPTGTSHLGSRTVTIPTTTPTGDYWLFACADDTALLAEFDETNNCRRATGNTIAVVEPPSTRPVADFTGDGATDVSVFRPSNGRWYISGIAG